jgi:hypothetical protein
VGEDLGKGGEGRLQANNNEKKGKCFQQNIKINGIYIRKKNPKFPNFWVKKMTNLLKKNINLN